ncbi:DUF2306 domain-containing protein [Sphingomonas crocodyli]|uniref:DUF2306 domain-containing protein n=1 Tax=Sphingomonas crocodyli TaxID=1979270 RepID=A0A437M4Q7_9SPHN|nr:DUF2306 domain-containing protein [Sphingomonas crocodyli]RVT92543.1 DUF2306 domain-containing protein [Sphingomonas crocodyli]
MATLPATAPKPLPTDIHPLLRAAMIAGGGLVTMLSIVAVLRWTAGMAPDHPALKQAAVAIHLVVVLPAVPLGLVLMLRRKGGRSHRTLGMIWMALMLATALSAIFIRNINGGGFSILHLFIPLTLFAVVRAIGTARQGRIDKHKRVMLSFYLGGLILPGLFAFLPGRLMSLWLLG